jgi:hypothetical protein
MSSFKVVGVSKLNGEYKVRFANDMLRVKVLEKNGHKDVDLVELVHPLPKVEAVQKLIDMGFAKGDKAIQAALEAALDKRTEKPKAASKDKPKKEAKKPKKVPAKAVTKAPAQKVAKVPQVSAADVEAQLEDAPF